MSYSVQITETSPLLHDANCVYCHVDLVLNDHAIVCERCESPHHHDCWQANGNQCATFGCRDDFGTAAIRSTGSSLRGTSRNGWPASPDDYVNEYVEIETSTERSAGLFNRGTLQQTERERASNRTDASTALRQLVTFGVVIVLVILVFLIARQSPWVFSYE